MCILIWICLICREDERNTSNRRWMWNKSMLHFTGLRSHVQKTHPSILHMRYVSCFLCTHVLIILLKSGHFTNVPCIYDTLTLYSFRFTFANMFYSLTLCLFRFAYTYMCIINSRVNKDTPFSIKQESSAIHVCTKCQYCSQVNL